MAAHDFVAELRVLHDRARTGSLAAKDRLRYEELRSLLVRMTVAGQSLGHAGPTLRSDLRVAKMLKVEVRPDDGKALRLTTIDIATRGFAAMLPDALALGSDAKFTLYLPGGAIAGKVLVASMKQKGLLVRTSFKFDALLPTAVEALDVFLLDSVLELLKIF